MTIREICINEFMEKNEIGGFSAAFSNALKFRQKLIEKQVKDFSCSCGIRFRWKLFQSGNSYLLTFGSDSQDLRLKHALLGIKVNQREHNSKNEVQ